MSLFGSGVPAAIELRRRILERLGAEPEWTEGDHGSREMRWTSGAVTSMFIVEPGSDATPDLAVLRVFTPIVGVRDAGMAAVQCNVLNQYTSTNRWTVEPAFFDPELQVMQVGCAFVVGPHNLAALEGFALWCVREQNAIATAKLTNDIAEVVFGQPVVTGGHAGGDFREPSDWHEVVYHYDNVVTPNRDLSPRPMLGALAGAFEGLRQEMSAQDAAWFSSLSGVDDQDLVCEMPFCWKPYPMGVIGDGGAALPGESLPTALVSCTTEPNPAFGNGLLLTMRVPWSSDDEALDMASRLNLCDQAVPGATHAIGAWTAAGPWPTYCAFLPAVLAEQDVDLPAVLREILLTFARQALLARRLLLDEENLMDEDRKSSVGLAAPAVPHGLAWGETGEGGNLGAQILGALYEQCVAGDTDWADPRPEGFTWWPYQQAQTISAVTPNAGNLAPGEGTIILIETDVRRDVTATPGALEAIAMANAELSQSALILREDGSLRLASRISIHEGAQWWAGTWARNLAVEQFITARELSTQLGDLGEEAASGHPISGMRPQPDDLFTVRQIFRDESAKIQTGLSDLVPLLGITLQHALPQRLSTAANGNLEFTWYLSQSNAGVEASTAIRGSVGRSETESGRGWLIHSHVQVNGDAAVKAAWCNSRNAELLAGSNHADVTMVGGWGTAPTGDCRLTTWVSPHFVRDGMDDAAELVGNLLRYHQRVVSHALAADPGAVTSESPTAAELAAGIESAISAFAEILDYPEWTDWSAEAADGKVVVRLEGRTWAGQPLAQMSYDNEDQQAEDVPPNSFTMALAVPLGRNRTQLSLLYSALLTCTQSDTWPGETNGFPSGWYARRLTAELESDGLLAENEQGEFTFSVGAGGAAQARFEIDYVKFGPNTTASALSMYDAHSMRVSAVITDPAIEISEVDGDLIGTWVRRPNGIAYQVVIPPIPAVWPGSYMLEDTLSWIGRHVIERTQEAAAP